MTTRKVKMFLYWLFGLSVSWFLLIAALPFGSVLALNALKFFVPVGIFFGCVLCYVKSKEEVVPLADNIIPLQIRFLECLAFTGMLAAYGHFFIAFLSFIHMLLELNVYSGIRPRSSVE